MSEFARQVVREEVALAPLVPTVVVQKRREKQLGAILGARVYCHFERAFVGNRLQCAFSNERKYLLGETVRDWLAAEFGANDFLWCEALDDDLAYVQVAGGRIVKDVAQAQDPRRELAAALARLSPEARLFAHPSVADEQLTAHSRRERIALSVRDRVARQRANGMPVSELGPVGEIPAVRVWNAVWKWTRVAALSAAAIAAVTFGYFQLREGQDAGTDQATRERSLTEYDRLLVAADAGALLAGLHANYRQFVGDPFLGGRWRIATMAWLRPTADGAVGNLQIDAELPRSPDDDADAEPNPAADVLAGVPWEELASLNGELMDYAAGRGWPVVVNDFRVTVRLPVAARPTSAEAGEAKRRPAPVDERDPWHFRSLRRDLEAFGELRPVADQHIHPTAYRHAEALSYQAEKYRLDLRGLEWAYADAARWLGDRLSGGPVVLDAVYLERVPAAAPGDRRGWRGSIQFRTIWCKADIVNSCEGPAAG